MGFINEKEHREQRIMYQQLTSNDKVYIITLDKSTGNYVLWFDNKKIANNKNPIKLYEKMED